MVLVAPQHVGAEARTREAIVRARVAAVTQRPDGWIKTGVSYELGGPCYDPVVTKALRELDPALAPLWCIKTYKTETGFEAVGRHLIARLVPSPIANWQPERFKRAGIRNVLVPAVVPSELAGLSSEGPYLESRLLEGPVPAGSPNGAPGCYLPMTMQLVEDVRISQHAIRNHRIEDLDLRRIARAISAEERAEAELWEDIRARTAFEKDRLLRAAGVRVTVGQTDTGAPVRMSESLLRLRKLAAEGDAA